MNTALSPLQVLLSQSELADDSTVTLNVCLLEVVEEVSSVTDHLLKSAAAVEVFLVSLEVRGEVVDAGGEESDLYLGGTRIAFVGCVLLNESELCVFLHGSFHLSKKYLCVSLSSRRVKCRYSSLVSNNRAHVIHTVL